MKLQILVPQYKETDEVIKPLLDSIAIQQAVDFSEIGVIICNDGSDVFLTEDLLSPESEHQKNSFGEFLFILNTLETYGMPLKTEILTLGKGTQISYYLCLSQLGAFAETIEKLQNFEISKNKKVNGKLTFLNQLMKRI